MHDYEWFMEKDKSLLLMALQQSVQTDGGQPSIFLRALADAVKEQFWLKLGMEDFKEFVTSSLENNGIGITMGDLGHLYMLKHKHEDLLPEVAKEMADMRSAVGRLINESDSEEGEAGGQENNQNASKTNDNNINNRFERQSPVGTSKQAGLRRLRKEVEKAKGTPQFEQVAQLRELVLSDQKSVNAALVELGVRTKLIQVAPYPAKIAKKLKEVLTQEQVSEVIELLQNDF